MSVRARPNGSPLTPSQVTLGRGPNTACSGDDPRLSDARESVLIDGVQTGKRRGINLIHGSNVTITGVDDPGNDKVDVTIDAAAPVTNVRVDYDGATVANVNKINFTDSGYATVTASYNPTTTAVDINVASFNTPPLEALGSTAPAANRLPYFDSGSTATTTDLTSFGRSLIDDADATAAKVTLGLAAIASTGSASDLSTGTAPTARLGSGTANSTTFLRGDQTWAAPAGGGGDILFADAPLTGVAVNNAAYQKLVSKSVTITAGDTLEVEVHGTILNNSGATQTYRFQVACGALTCEAIDGTTVAASSTNRATFKVKAVLSVASTSSSGATLFLERNVPAAANTAGSIATTTVRYAFQNGLSNITGAQTLDLNCRSGTTTAIQTVTVFSYTIRQIPKQL